MATSAQLKSVSKRRPSYPGKCTHMSHVEAQLACQPSKVQRQQGWSSCSSNDRAGPVQQGSPPAKSSSTEAAEHSDAALLAHLPSSCRLEEAQARLGLLHWAPLSHLAACSKA
jgi:hypothetical protein